VAFSAFLKTAGAWRALSEASTGEIIKSVVYPVEIAGVEFIDENGGGRGRAPHGPQRPRRPKG